MRQNKFRNNPTEWDGIKFDSKKECSRYIVLKMMEDNGEITDLRRQVRYLLIPTQKICGKTERSIYYVADFVYCKNGTFVVEDVKGFRTQVYKIKRRLMKQIHGIEVVEV